MSAPASPIPALPEPESITASLLLGALFNWALLGVLGCQTYLYNIYFPNDKAAFKYLIYGVFLFETIQSALVAHDTYVWFSKGFGDFVNLTKVLTSPLNTPMMGAVTALIVQLFYAHRIWTFKRALMPLCVVLVVITLAQSGAAFFGGIRAFQAGNFIVAQTDKANTRGVYVWLIGEAVADVLIAAAMVYIIMLHRASSHRFRAHSVLARVVSMTVESNIATATLAVLSLIMYAGVPNTNYFTCPTLIIGKVYANTLLVSFNNRIVLRNLSHGSSPSLSTGSTTAAGTSRLTFHKHSNSTPHKTFDSDTVTYTVHRFTDTESSSGRMDHELHETSKPRDYPSPHHQV
ncbi:hypothetical protein VNI00_009959 [Paramarasmius palmivorus]|uniref:DUF6534 domain-containing protein n=1 Tax=Paramarasmius palmivorus TaxID=297713 RepID=A0AAW0CMM8_9AGAR